jgi:hypothetical protein
VAGKQSQIGSSGVFFSLAFFSGNIYHAGGGMHIQFVLGQDYIRDTKPGLIPSCIANMVVTVVTVVNRDGLDHSHFVRHFPLLLLFHHLHQLRLYRLLQLQLL